MVQPLAGYILSADALRRLKEGKRQPNNRPNRGKYSSGQHSRYLARITGKAVAPPYPDSVAYTAEQVLTDVSGETPPLSGGLSWGGAGDQDPPPLIDMRSAGIYQEAYTGDFKRVPIGAIVEVFYLADENGDMAWYFNGPTLGELFAVDVTTDGGTAGDAVTQCSFTYEVFDLDGFSLATAKTPVWARPSVGAMIVATHGMAYWGETELFLYTVDEMQDLEICVDSGV